LRSIQVHVRAEEVDLVLSRAREHDAQSAVALRGERGFTSVGDGSGGQAEVAEPAVLLLTLPNDRIGAFIDAVRSDVDDAGFIVVPVGVLPLATPVDRVDEQVRDVSRLSTLELVLASLQSVGSWRGLLVYSVLAGTIGGYGLIFDVVYLLVAAMLINPMGAPAQVAVIGLAIGDPRMFARGGGRFLVSLVAQALSAMAMGFGYGLSVSTSMMEQVASLSTWGVVVALAAGAAGAQTQVRSDRDSLVSGTAAGFMVAAALAPPAAVLGLAVTLARWDYVGLMAFLLALQFLAIAVGGGILLHASGVRPRKPSVGRGTPGWRSGLGILVASATLLAVAWQVRSAPRFQKADLSLQALEIARDALEAEPAAFLVESSARFTRRDIERDPREALLFEIVAARLPGAPADEVLERRIREGVRGLVAERMVGVLPFVEVTVVDGKGEALPPRTP
jgi:uncharacterized membrane protein